MEKILMKQVKILTRQEKNYRSIGRNDFDAALQKNGSQDYAQSSGRKKLEDKFEHLIYTLIKPHQKSLSRSMLVDRFCPVCGDMSQPELLMTKYKLPIVTCRKCEFIYTDPTLKPAINTELINGSDVFNLEHIKFLTSPTYSYYAAIRYAYELQQIEKQVKNKNRNLLDIGCSVGGFMEKASEYGWKGTGVEINERAVNLASAKKLKVIFDCFNSQIFNNKPTFDLVTHHDVLEHIIDPQSFISDISKVTLPGGLMMVQVPNVKSLVVMLEKEKNQIFNGLIHVNYFSLESLKNLIEPHGFEAVHMETVLSELSIVEQYTLAEINNVRRINGFIYPWKSFDENTILNENLGYKIIGIFRKKA